LNWYRFDGAAGSRCPRPRRPPNRGGTHRRVPGLLSVSAAEHAGLQPALLRAGL